MIVTEIEAFAKACPQQFLPNSIGGNCMASRCMAWRFVDTPVPNDPIADQRRGFCGIAYTVRLP